MVTVIRKINLPPTKQQHYQDKDLLEFLCSLRTSSALLLQLYVIFSTRYQVVSYSKCKQTKLKIENKGSNTVYIIKITLKHTYYHIGLVKIK